jgi:hypothetical protein
VMSGRCAIRPAVREQRPFAATHSSSDTSDLGVTAGRLA